MLEETIKRIKETPLLNISTAESQFSLSDLAILPKNQKGGRKKQTHYRTEAIQRLHENVLNAVRVIGRAVKGKKDISWLQFQAATYNIDQVVGKSKVRIEADIGEKSFDRLLKMALESQRQLPEGTIEGEYKEIDVQEQRSTEGSSKESS